MLDLNSRSAFLVLVRAAALNEIKKINQQVHTLFTYTFFGKNLYDKKMFGTRCLLLQHMCAESEFLAPSKRAQYDISAI